MYRRIFALILAFVMAFSLVPVTAFATEEAQETEPVVTEPMVSEPKATEPKATEPKATEPKATEPKATEPKATEPKATEPQATEPKATEPKATEPQTTEPKATEPVATEPKATEPKVTEPQVTEPKATEPQATEPKATEPPVQEKPVTGSKKNIEVTSITAKFTFEFPEDSGLSEDSVGSVEVVLGTFNSDGDPDEIDSMNISADNDWTAYFEPQSSGKYSIHVQNANVDGYYYDVFGDRIIDLETGESVSRTFTISYTEIIEDPEDPEDEEDWDDEDDGNADSGCVVIQTVSLVFAEDSALKSEDLGDITVSAYGDEGNGASAVLTHANNRTSKLRFLEPENCEIFFEGLARDGYVYTLEGNRNINPYDTDQPMVITVKYIKLELDGAAQFAVSFDFAEDSVLQDTDIGNLVARFYDEDGKLVGQAVATQENGRTASITLDPGSYEVYYGGDNQPGYKNNLDSSEFFTISAGERVSRSYTLRYERNEAKVKVSIDFAEDSALKDADIGDISVEAYGWSSDKTYKATLTSANGRTAELTVLPEEYELSLQGYQKEGYDCTIIGEDDWDYVYAHIGETEQIHLTLQYTKKCNVKLNLSLAFAEDSVYQDADIGDITARIYHGYADDPSATLILTQENNRTAEVELPAGSYCIRFSGHEKEGYFCGFNGYEEEEQWVYLNGEEAAENFELRYVKDEGKVTVALYLEDLADLEEADIGPITVEFYDYYDENGELVKAVELTKDNGWEATVGLPDGEYDIKFSGYAEEGYYCNLEDEYGYIWVWRGYEYREEFYCYYGKTELPELEVSLYFTAASALKSADVGDITAEIYGYTTDDDEESEPVLLDTIALTAANGRSGRAALPAGYYYIYFRNYEQAGYYCTLEDHYSVWMDSAGGTYSRSYPVVYVDNEVDFSVSLDFAEDSALNTDDLGDITAQIFRMENDWEDEETLVGSIVLTKENGRTGKLPVKLEGYYETDHDSMEYGWNNSCQYELRFVGMEQEGHRYTLENADDLIDPIPGDEAGWKVTAKYAKAENDVTVKIRLSEDSNIPAAKLKEKISLNLADTVGGMVNESIKHTGSTVFTHVFKSLPDSDRYCLDLDIGIGSLQAITCSGGELSKNLKQGQLEFSLNGDCEIEVVLEAKQTADDEATLIIRFAENSALKAEDLPQGITLAVYHEINRTYYAVDKTVTFSPENDWTQVIKVTGSTAFAISEHPEGYMGTVDGGVSIDDCPITVYLDVCFEEYKPYYLDVELLFDENSDLTSEEVGSIFMDVNDNGTARSFEFKEGSWHQIIELNGNINSISEEYEFFDLALRNLARLGYSYTIEPAYEENEYGNAKDNYVDDSFAIFTWERGKTVYYTVKLCYTEDPGKLVVDLVSSPYGHVCDAIVTVTDEKGNEVAQAVCDENHGYQCAFDLPEAGTYTVATKVKEPSKHMEYVVGDPVTIQFDPAAGATVTLLCEERGRTNLEIFKFFDENSELGPEDFPEGITVVLTDVTGCTVGEYELNDANGWSTSVSLPDGSYTVTEKNADKKGYIRTTQFVFARSADYTVGGESLRPMDLRNRAQEPEELNESVTNGLVGGPYYIHGVVENYNNLTIHNSYVTDPNAKSTGSITITAGDAFYRYGGDKLPGNPGTGYEAEAYTYRVVIDGEEQTVTLEPGETMTLDGIKAGTQYSITPVLPDGYVWNASDATISGTVGSDPEDEESLNVKVNFDNDYYYDYEDSNLTILKTDALTDEALKGAKFGLYADKECTKKIATATTGKDGTCGFTITEAGTYYIKELKAPETYYVKSTEVMTVTAEEEWVKEDRDGTRVLVAKMNVTVEELSAKDGAYIWENERKTTDISVTKKFAHDEDLERPDSVTIVLYQDGEAYETVKLSKANNWKYVWEDMPLGFEYTVDEVNVAKGYYKQIRSSGYDFTVINSGHWNPQTGDDSMIALWISTATLSLVALAVLNEKKRRQRA